MQHTAVHNVHADGILGRSADFVHGIVADGSFGCHGLQQPSQHEYAVVVNDYVNVHVWRHSAALHTAPFAAFFEAVQAELLTGMKRSARSQYRLSSHIKHRDKPFASRGYGGAASKRRVACTSGLQPRLQARGMKKVPDAPQAAACDTKIFRGRQKLRDNVIVSWRAHRDR